MVLAQINSIGKLTPIQLGSAHDFRSSNPSEEASVSYGSQSERGKATLRITLLNEIDLNEILEVVIVGGSPIKAKLIAHKKSFLGGQEIELHFDTVFDRGFKDSIRQYIYAGGGIIGFTSREREQLGSIEMQRKLFDILVDFMMTSHMEAIKALAIPCHILKLSGENHDKGSHFCGVPKFGYQKPQPSTVDGRKLFHISTLFTNDFSDLFKDYSDYELLTRLSFYLDIENTEKGWPVEHDRFKVINYQSADIGYEYPDIHQQELTINCNERLDIPGPDHSTIQYLKLDGEGIERYTALRATFFSIVSKKEQAENKLLGYPDNSKTCAAFEAERFNSKTSYSQIKIRSCIKWQLLLQISPEAYQFKFFDKFGKGTIFFMIKKSDIQSGRFDDIQVVVQ